MGTPSTPRRYGQTLFVLAWLVLAALLYLYFDSKLARQYNPNQRVASEISGQSIAVNLLRNRQGHYVASGQINGHDVVMMVDTGATRISIPESVATRLSLRRGQPYPVETANGTVTVWHTRIDQLSIGALTLYDLDANINPGLGDSTILLGMNALKDLELIQRGDTLTLRKY
ncbi:retropepsin-like aspartic protease family protein [Ferrimonas balearica]|uniref:retropepsin-like aspartic protease family protein n=1 Tax=Ferrimonas balearica TaxID=44012 RepID=UPI001F2C3EDE|nr:TIGR02281 family clan AA aspartic protease [Ferrimonas balearica]MBY6096488.1 TIGR02281 family clan AA aspartic protease [Ferrimonas balearica]